MSRSAIVSVAPLGFPWPTIDPFLFCVYHDDAYPKANAQMGPDDSLAGRELGQDFSRKDGWSMYHGHPVPGFPGHPHRGFETVTVVRKGLIDHADSLGAIARFGGGDVQWLTAGKGIVHSEMFPLLDTSGANPLELFQIWLNLPAKAKMAEPHFTMFWHEDIPRSEIADAAGHTTQLSCVAGRFVAAESVGQRSPTESLGRPTPTEGLSPPALPESLEPLPPPPDSWASDSGADLAIWTLRMAPNARFTLPAAALATTRRSLYFFKGASVGIDGVVQRSHAAVELRGDQAVELVNGDVESEFLMLQGCPIGEPVVQSGPFVINTEAEIAQTYADYRRTQFGGWPWGDAAPTHGRDPARFARRVDGRHDAPPVPASAIVPVELEVTLGSAPSQR